MKPNYTYDDIQIVPSTSSLTSRDQCSLSTEIVEGWNLESPVVSSPMDTVTEYDMANSLSFLGGLGFIHRFMSIEEQVHQAQRVRKSKVGWRECGCAIGLKDADTRVHRLYEAGVRLFLIDVAHGGMYDVASLAKDIKLLYDDAYIVAGSVADGFQVRWFVDDDSVDAVRVGVGNGSNCTTRLKTGIGVPQASAIVSVKEALEGTDIKIIADGGIRYPGDVAKALALGADTVMIGSLLAGTREAPGQIIRQGGTWPSENLWKKYSGAASYEGKISRGEEGKNVEGVSRLVPYVGKVERIINDIHDGVRSAMSYVGASTLEEFRARVEFIQVTESGKIEAKAHGLF